MKIFWIKKDLKKEQESYRLLDNQGEFSILIHRAKGWKLQYHLKNKRGEIFSRIEIRKLSKRIHLWFPKFAIDVWKDRGQYFIEYYRKKRYIEILGEIDRGSHFSLIEGGKVLSTVERKPMDAEEEWIYYTDELEELTAILFGLKYLSIED